MNLGKVERCGVHVQDSGSARDKGKGRVMNLGKVERDMGYAYRTQGVLDMGKGKV